MSPRPSHAPAPTSSGPPSLGPLVRRHDPDRYFCALFAPAAHRETLFTLYAFNHELARACEVTREPGLSLIRLQWWREIVEGAPKAHEVATPLLAALAEARLHPASLLAMIEAREREADADFQTLADWQDWLHQGPGSLAVAAAQALGAPDALHPRLRSLGAGIGAAGQLRNIDAFAGQGRCLLPLALLTHHNLTPASIIADPSAPAMTPLRADIANVALDLLGTPQVFARRFISAALPAVLARRDLRRGTIGHHGIGDRIAVLKAAGVGCS